MSMMELGQALGGPPGGGPMEIDVPAPGGPGELPPEDEAPESSIDALDLAEDALNDFIRLDPDEVDRAEAGKALQIVLKLKAINQQSSEKGDMRSLRRALAGGGAPPGGPPVVGGAPPLG